MNTRRVLLVGLIAAVVGTVGIVLALDRLFDPGDKNDTSTNLVTPTIAAASARVFEADPEQSQVNFTTQVGGADIDGVFPVSGGSITLEPVGDELRVLVRVDIHIDAMDAGIGAVERVMRAALSTGDYPIAFFVGTSRELVPVTEDEIMFVVDGQLQVNNRTAPSSMNITAQLVGGDMWAVGTSTVDVANHDVQFEGLLESTLIGLTARLQFHEVESLQQEPIIPPTAPAGE